MEQRKPRNKKGGRQRSPEQSQDKSAPKNSGIKKLIEKDYDYTSSDKTQFAHLKRETQETVDQSHGKRQVVSNWSKYKEIEEDETSCVAQDFQSLLNAPVSEGGHFVFKSEKNWAVQISAYSEFFSLNVKKLGTAVDCIPFIHYIDVEEKYFTKDQLTQISNKAEKAKRAYSDILNNVELPKSDNKFQQILEEIIRKEIEDNNPQIESDDEIDFTEPVEDKNTVVDEDDLDFLLSLKEPSPLPSTLTINQDVAGASRDSRNIPAAAPTKSIDLEKWLDSVLDD